MVVAPTPNAVDDLPRLVAAAQRGDRLAMADLLDRLAPYVGRICASIALDDGPDAAQESLVLIFRNIGRLHEPAALFGWARTIAVREATRLARQAPRTIDIELAGLPAPGDPQLAADVSDVLRRLSPEHRAALVLRDLEGLDEKTMSEVLAVAPGTVKSRISRAREQFAKAWSR